MGSLASRPKAPSTPQIVYVPQPAVTAPAPTATNTSTTEIETEAASSADAFESEVRADDLLRRGRSRTGTVRTSFRGLLDSITNTPKKTLLGE